MLTGHDDTTQDVEEPAYYVRSVRRHRADATTASRQVVGFSAFALFFCLCCLFVKRRLPEIQERRRLRRMLMRQQQQEERDADALEQRRAFVKKLLPVRAWDGPHNSEDDSVLGVLKETADGSSCCSNGEHVCSICLTGYRPCENVSWSSNPSCHHEFHTECIQSWLLKHKECPMCRVEYLPDPNSKPEEESNEEDLERDDGEESSSLPPTVVATRQAEEP